MISQKKNGSYIYPKLHQPRNVVKEVLYDQYLKSSFTVKI